MDERESEILRVASALHDVGKLAIPDAILQKPSKLTDEEYNIMKKHSTFGGEMFLHATRHVLQPAGVIALQHHERYDGTGYPRGLKGDQIHIYARITAVADVFDAITTDRIYRKAMPLDEAIEYFKSERGKQFDPAIVDVLLENMDEVKIIKGDQITG
jgi:HD-GYP domain-containing protein (c-di-GMP phosphodiesterase class II)